MTNYALLVFTKKDQEIDDLLDPYYEGIEVTPYISRTKDQIINGSKKIKEDILERMEKQDYKPDYWDKKYLECQTDEDFYKIGIYRGGEYDVFGNELSTYNPNSKWESYDIGGHWSGSLKTKNGQQVDRCLVKDLDLTPDQETYDEEIRFWELVVEEQPLKDGEEKPFHCFDKEYYIKRYETKENYAKIQSQFITYAVLMPDGRWYDSGKMGLFGLSQTNIKERKEWEGNFYKFFEQAEDEWTVTVIDCQI